MLRRNKGDMRHGQGTGRHGLRHAGHRQRAFGPPRRGAVGQARQIGAGGRQGPAPRRRLRAHRHHPVEDAARDGAQPFRLARARLLRPRLPGQAGHFDRRSGRAPAQDARPRGRGAAAPVHAQHGQERARHGEVPRSQQGQPDHRHRRLQRGRFRQCADRGRHAAAPAARRALRQDPRLRQRRDAGTRPSAAYADGDRRRRHRRRICDDLLGARRAGDAGRAAQHHPRFRRPRDRRRFHPPDARPRHDDPARQRGQGNRRPNRILPK